MRAPIKFCGALLLSGLGIHGVVSANEKRKAWDSNWDGRAGVAQAGAPHRNYLLIRHGQYVTTASGEGKVLTELGREQATLTGRRLKEMKIPVRRIHCSTMVRARETAEIIAKELGQEVEIVHTDLIREGKTCVPEPFSDSLGRPLPGTIDSWDLKSVRHNYDIETFFKKFFHRSESSGIVVTDVVRRSSATHLSERDEWEVVVGHGNVFRYYTLRLLQLAPEAWLRTSLPNASITWLVVRPNGLVSLKGFGDANHMPFEKITFN